MPTAASVCEEPPGGRRGIAEAQPKISGHPGDAECDHPIADERLKQDAEHGPIAHQPQAIRSTRGGGAKARRRYGTPVRGADFAGAGRLAHALGWAPQQGHCREAFRFGTDHQVASAKDQREARRAKPHAGGRDRPGAGIDSVMEGVTTLRASCCLPRINCSTEQKFTSYQFQLARKREHSRCIL